MSSMPLLAWGIWLFHYLWYPNHGSCISNSPMLLNSVWPLDKQCKLDSGHMKNCHVKIVRWEFLSCSIKYYLAYEYCHCPSIACVSQSLLSRGCPAEWLDFSVCLPNPLLWAPGNADGPRTWSVLASWGQRNKNNCHGKVDREGGKSRDSRRESTPGKSSRFFRGEGRKAPGQTPGGRHREHEKGTKEGEPTGKQCLLFSLSELSDAADREDTLFLYVCDGRHVFPAGTAFS